LKSKQAVPYEFTAETSFLGDKKNYNVGLNVHHFEIISSWKSLLGPILYLNIATTFPNFVVYVQLNLCTLYYPACFLIRNLSVERSKQYYGYPLLPGARDTIISRIRQMMQGLFKSLLEFQIQKHFLVIH